MDRMNTIFFDVKKAEADKAEEICFLLQKSISDVCMQDYGNDDSIKREWLMNKTPKNVADWISNTTNISYVAIDKKTKKIIGFILANNQYILLNYLLPEYMYKGVGKALLNLIEKYYIESGLSEIRVDSTITARNFYIKNGFLDNGEPILVGSSQGEFPMIKYFSRGVPQH